MQFEEKRRLAEAIYTLPPHRLAEIVTIVSRSVEPREEIEIDIDLLSQEVLLEIKRVVDAEFWLLSTAWKRALREQASTTADGCSSAEHVVANNCNLALGHDSSGQGSNGNK